MKPIRWVRSSLEDLRKFPEDARGEIGHGLRVVQGGGTPDMSKSLHHDLSGVTELVSDSEDSNTYRAVYTVKLDR